MSEVEYYHHNFTEPKIGNMLRLTYFLKQAYSGKKSAKMENELNGEWSETISKQVKSKHGIMLRFT